MPKRQKPPEKSRRSIGFRVEEARPAYRVRRRGDEPACEREGRILLKVANAATSRLTDDSRPTTGTTRRPVPGLPSASYEVRPSDQTANRQIGFPACVSEGRLI